VEGLSNKGLVLSTNGMDLEVPPNATSFVFPKSLSYGDVYNVVTKGKVEHQTCAVGAFLSQSGVMLNSGSDTAGRLSSINIGVQCVLDSFTIGGNVTGLTSEGLILTNGSSSDMVTVTAAAPTFTFASPVTYGLSYGVTVLHQPDNAICTVGPKGTGVMADAAVTDIAVSCVKT
jgi:hypothetical protein